MPGKVPDSPAVPDGNKLPPPSATATENNSAAKAVLLIGKYDQKNLDAVTGATTRKDKSDVVTFVK